MFSRQHRRDVLSRVPVVPATIQFRMTGRFSYAALSGSKASAYIGEIIIA